MNYFYLDEQNQEIGPVSLENLKAFRSAGAIQDHTLVRAENVATWSACVSVTGPVETPAADKLQTEAAQVVSATYADAKQALALMATNPVGGLAPAYQKLGHKRAGAVGIFFVIVSALGSAFILRGMIDSLSSMSFGMINVGILTGSFAKSLLITAVVPVALVFALALVRLTSQRGGRIEGDLFIAGANSLVFTMELLLFNIVGLKNAEVLVIIYLVAVCITVLQIFVGLTRISELSEPRATLAVPIVIVLAVWLSTVIWRAMI